MIEVRLNMLRIIERHDILTLMGEQLPGASVAAVNDTLEQLHGIAVTSLSAVVNAPREEIAARVLVTPASRVTRIAASGGIYISRKLIPLKFFNPQQTAAGVKYSPTAGKPRTVKHAFGPDIPRLGGGVWKRLGRKRLPIGKAPGFSMATSKTVASVMDRVAGQADELLMRNIDIHVGRFLTNLTAGKTTFAPTYIDRKRRAWVGFGKYRSITSAPTRRR